MKNFKLPTNKKVYLSDIINYNYTSPLANDLEMIRSYDQSILNLKNKNSKNYFNLCDYRKTKK
jgi:hypothetical protein